MEDKLDHLPTARASIGTFVAWPPVQLTLSGGSPKPALAQYDDSRLIFELIQRGYAVALVPAQALAAELEK